MALPKVGVEMVAENASPFLRAISDGDKAVRGFGQTAANTGPQFSAFEQIATGAFQRVGHMVTDFAMQAGRALIGFGADSITLAGDYEATLNRFSSVTGSSLAEAGYEVDDFSKLFLQLGADTQFSAQQAADAGVELAKGGVPIEQIMGDATEATLALAAAGELELAPAAEIVAKQLGVWGDRGVTATQAADLLAQAANASTVNVDELALGMANVGGTAKVAGVSFQETVQAMALLAPGFSSAADAGTSFKTFLTKLIPKTSDEVGMMQQLGLYTEETGSVFYDATGSFVGMEQASQLLHEATKDLSEEQKSLAFHTVFGADAIRAAAIISEQGAVGFNEMGASMTAAGTASAQAAERNKGFNFALESLRGSLETIKILIGTAVLPVLTSFINDFLIPGAGYVMDFVSAVSEAGFGSIEMYEVLGNLGEKVIPQILAGVPLIRQAFLDWALGAAQWTLDAMPMLLDGLGQFLQGAITWAVESAITFGQQMLAFGEQAVAWIAPRLPALGEQLGQFLNTMVNWVVASLPAWMAQLQQLGMAAIQWVKNALPGLGQNLGEFAGALLGWIVKTIGDVTPKLLELAGKFIAWIATDVVPQLPAAAEAIWTALNTFINTAAERAVLELAKLGMRFNEWVEKDVLPVLPGRLALIWDTIVAWVSDTSRKIVAQVKAIGEGIIDGIIAGAGALGQKLYDALAGSISGAIDDVKSFFGIRSPSDYTNMEIGQPLMAGITEGVLAAAPSLETTIVDSIGTALDAGNLTAELGGQAINSTLGAQLAESQAIISALQAAMGTAQSLQAGIGQFGGGGHRIQPHASPNQMFGGATTTINGPTISFAPTYNSAPPAQTMDFATVQAFAQ